MKRPVVTALFLCAAAALPGCPIYDHEDAGCYRDGDCASNFVCDVDTGECYQPTAPPPADSSCNRPSDCAANETCNKAGQCVSGDCTFSGCVSGYECDSSSGVWLCLAAADGAAGAGGMSGAAGAPAVGAAGEAAAGQAGATP
ncbi:MAG: hypothetical protein ABJB12_02960 [Pseudomonadota bacterium]